MSSQPHSDDPLLLLGGPVSIVVALLLALGVAVFLLWPRPAPKDLGPYCEKARAEDIELAFSRYPEMARHRWYGDGRWFEVTGHLQGVRQTGDGKSTMLLLGTQGLVRCELSPAQDKLTAGGLICVRGKAKYVGEDKVEHFYLLEGQIVSMPPEH